MIIFFLTYTFISGDELRWRFTSDSSVNGWGWRFTVHPILPSHTIIVSQINRIKMLFVTLAMF